MSSKTPHHLDLKITLQRASLLWESLWNAVQLPLIVVGIAVVVLASGGLEWLPKWAQLVALVILGLAFLYSLKNLFKVKSASRLLAMRRMELHSNVNHRSLSGHADKLAAESHNYETGQIGRAHV